MQWGVYGGVYTGALSSFSIDEEGDIRGMLGGGADQDSQWRISIGPGTKCHFIGHLGPGGGASE